MIFIKSRTRLRRRDFWLLHVVPALLVFVVVMLIIALNAQSTQRQNALERHAITRTQAEEIELRISERIYGYIAIAAASSAHINSENTVSRDQFSNFIRMLNLTQRYPGLYNISYAQFVPASELGPFIDAQRQSGLPDFQVFPEPTADRLLVITYSEPLNEQNGKALGFNILSEPDRTDAVNRAIDTGQPALTRNVRLVSEPEGRQAFVIYVPTYRTGATPADTEARRAATTGVVSASFIAEDFFRGLFADLKNGQVGFQIFQGTNPPMYTDESYEDMANDIGASTAERTLTIAGQNWTIRYVFDTGMLGTGLSRGVFNTIVSGTLFAALLALLVFVLLMSRTRSLSVAEEREIQHAKDDLLSLASHQLRTPATSVKQYLGMIKDGYAGELTEQQMALLDEAYSSNERQLGIINEMLYVARADAGRIVLDKTTLSLNKLLRDIHKDQFPRARAYQQRFHLIVPKMDVTIMGDGHYLRMAIENLIGNAIKYTPQSGTITLKLTRDKNNAVITVSDTGVGIPKKDHRKLFQKFSRVPNELSTRTNGTGVGLYLAKQIIELHEGAITFTSDTGKGTTFTIRLPKIHEEEPK